MSVHRSDEPDGLVGDLCEVLASPLADPLAPEIVSVPTRGIERWITERIALTFGERGPEDGICANIEFPFPRRLTSDLLSTDPAARASIEAWARARVVRQIDHLIRGHAGEDWMWVITRFIRGLDDGASAGVQRLRAANRVERLFSGYARYRPELLEAWTAGSDVASNGDPIDASAVWQPTLWRHLRAAIGTPPLHEVLPAALASLRTGAAVDLPERISVYGITAIDPVDLSVLDAVSGYADVHLFVLHPSPTLWSAIAGSTS